MSEKETESQETIFADMVRISSERTDLNQLYNSNSKL